MAFWGVEVKPGKPYVHRSDEERGRLHVSQATLGTGSSSKKSIVQCKVGDKKPINLCSLFPEVSRILRWTLSSRKRMKLPSQLLDLIVYISLVSLLVIMRIGIVGRILSLLWLNLLMCFIIVV